MASENIVADLNSKNVLLTSLIAGGLAGSFVDATLFPIDTLKTRLQSEQGLLKSGGFKGLYKGILPVIVGSAPTAAVFFVTYNGIKSITQPFVSEKYHSFLHMGAASFSEAIACLVRVPVEVMKQRKQALLSDKGNVGLRLLYRGYWSTVVRDMPFSFLQFPLWEYFKKVWSIRLGRDCVPIEGAICGATAGALSAAITTPLDVAKTRIILSNTTLSSSETKIFFMLRTIYMQDNIKGLFSGIGPRVIWITVGGFIFFGIYEKAKLLTEKHILKC